MRILYKIWSLYERAVYNIVELFSFGKIVDSDIKKLVLFADFCLVGILSSFVSLGCYYVVIAINADWYNVGYSTGFIISVLNSYFWNSNFVFHKTDEKIKTLIKTYASYGSTFILGNIFLYVMINNFGMSEVVAPIINIVITTPLNFFINKLWAYRGKK